MKNYRQLIVIVSFAFSLASCQTGRELHYIKCGDNYFRIRIHEASFASKSRYLCGYFDEQAVERYFSEMSQPKEGNKDKEGNAITRTEGERTFYEQIFPNGDIKSQEGKKLIMLLSTNSEAISSQIGAFVENEEILSAIAKIANKSALEENKNLQSRIDNIQYRNRSVATIGDNFIANADTNMSLNQTKATVLTYLEMLKAYENDPGNKDLIEALIEQFKN